MFYFGRPLMIYFGRPPSGPHCSRVCPLVVPKGRPLLSFDWKEVPEGLLCRFLSRDRRRVGGSQKRCGCVRIFWEIHYLIRTPRTLILDALVKYVIFLSKLPNKKFWVSPTRKWDFQKWFFEEKIQKFPAWYWAEFAEIVQNLKLFTGMFSMIFDSFIIFWSVAHLTLEPFANLLLEPFAHLLLELFAHLLLEPFANLSTEPFANHFD